MIQMLLGRNIMLYVAAGFLIVGGFLYVQNMAKTIAILEEQNTELVRVNKTNIDTIDKMVKDYAATTERLDKLSRDLQDAQRDNQELRDKFLKHDLKELAKRKPALIEKTINNGTVEVIDEINEITATPSPTDQP